MYMIYIHIYHIIHRHTDRHTDTHTQTHTDTLIMLKTKNRSACSNWKQVSQQRYAIGLSENHRRKKSRGERGGGQIPKK